MHKYDFLLNTDTKEQWKTIGINRRSGVSVPLFSIYSKKSVGIGDILDLKILIDWCSITGNTIIQLLPLNDTGTNFRPYDSDSSFALDPIYLSLEKIIGLNKSFSNEINILREKFQANTERVNYEIKNEKIKILWDMFKYSHKEYIRFKNFKRENEYWLNDYSLFKVLKEINNYKNYNNWDDKLKNKDEKILEKIKLENSEKYEFYKWIQWQIYEQFSEVRVYAKKKQVLIMGDIPFLISRDSCDVWANPSYFKLDYEAGAPPDAYQANGQRWGMPAYSWPHIADDNYDYLIKKIQYAENFYDIFRIDHVVGLFRLWTININEDPATQGLNGKYDPSNKELWEHHGRSILEVIVENTKMMPTAEDLGVVPDECTKVLKEMGILGLDVQRWSKDRTTKPNKFKKPEDFRLNSCAIISSHDMSNSAFFWEHEIETIDENLFIQKCIFHNIDYKKFKNILFDISLSLDGRLRWNKNIFSLEKLLEVLGKSHCEVYGIVDMYIETFNEKLDLWNSLGMSGALDEHWSKKIIESMVEYIAKSSSIFCMQSALDLMLLEYDIKDIKNFRINVPGTVGESNWSLRLPLNLEDMLNMKMNNKLLEINKKYERI
jgi:4-alpha-glucanotransferase